MYDVAIIGAGVSGCSVARELSRYDARVVVLEREDDVCCGTTKANSAIVHAGFDATPGSLMARFNAEGNRRMPGLCAELGVEFDNIGSLVVCTDEAALPGLDELLERGRENGIEGLRIVLRDELVEMEPNISDAAIAALWAPTAGIVNPFQLNFSLADCAAVNGVEFRFNSRVTDVTPSDGGWRITTKDGALEAKVVVNAAGVYADELHNMVSADKLTVIPRRGQYYILDTTAGKHVSHVIFAQPTAMGKGVLVAPTTAGNLLVGPSAEDIDDKQGTDTTADVLADVAAKAAITVKNVPLRETITSFSGLRAHQPGHDFVIGEVADAPGFFDVAAIESPGLSAAPAIGPYVAGLVADKLALSKREGFVPGIPPIPEIEHSASPEDWAALIEKNPAYGRVICRCRKVTEGQIVEAIHRPVPARSLDAVKRRTHACMGRCQAGFCTPKIMEILARELADLDYDEVSKAGPGSEFIVGINKDVYGAASDCDALPASSPKGGDAR